MDTSASDHLDDGESFGGGGGGGGGRRWGLGIQSFFTNLLLSFVVVMLEMLAKRNTHILSS